MFISVKAAPGRVAFSAPRGGERIPNDRFVLVENTPWVARLIEHHGDLIAEPKAEEKSSKADKNAPAA